MTTNSTQDTSIVTTISSASETGTMSAGSESASDASVGPSGSDTATASSTVDPSDTSTVSASTGSSGTTGTTAVDPSNVSETSGPPPDFGPPTPCEDFDILTAEPIPTYMVLVLDKSGSMFGNSWDHDNDGNTPEITRWNSLYDVVDEIVNAYEDKIEFGVQLYPWINAAAAYNESACQTGTMPEVATGPNNAAAILNAIPGAMVTQSFGGTPSQRGVESAVDHLLTKDAMANRAIMFISDGAANCQAGTNPPPLFENYDNTLHTTVSDAFTNDGITTYVVGIDIVNASTGGAQDGNPDNVNPFQKLNELAQQGGVPNMMGNTDFYDSQNQIELEAALDAIAMEAISCEVPLPAAPPEPDNVVIQVDGMDIPWLGMDVTECPMDPNQPGWYYSTIDEMADPPVYIVTLCGTSCAELKISGDLDAEFYCTPG